MPEKRPSFLELERVFFSCLSFSLRSFFSFFSRARVSLSFLSFFSSFLSFFSFFSYSQVSTRTDSNERTMFIPLTSSPSCPFRCAPSATPSSR